MARIAYALSGQGRGHASRVLAMADALGRRDHEILFMCGGTAFEVLSSRVRNVVELPCLKQVVRGNRLSITRTLLQNKKLIFNRPRIVNDTAEILAGFRPDLVITDFEAFTPMAADRLGIPVLSFNHQEIVTRTRYSLPLRYHVHALLTRTAIRLVAPRSPVHTLLTSFYFPQVKDAAATTLVRPIIRPAVTSLVPRDDGHVLVYFNQSSGSEFVLDALRRTRARFVVYNFAEPDGQRYDNIAFKGTSVDEFLDDLAGCTAVISTAGFTLMSEALYLGKPIMVVPNNGIFEQTLNALFLQKEGLGAAVFNRSIRTDDVTAFLERRTEFARRIRGRAGSGNMDAVYCIERILRNTGATLVPLPAQPQPASIIAETLAPSANG